MRPWVVIVLVVAVLFGIWGIREYFRGRGVANDYRRVTKRIEDLEAIRLKQLGALIEFEQTTGKLEGEVERLRGELERVTDDYSEFKRRIESAQATGRELEKLERERETSYGRIEERLERARAIVEAMEDGGPR